MTLAHPKAKEWIVSMAKSNYHELAKLANEYPELVKLQVSSAYFVYHLYFWKSLLLIYLI